MFAFKHNSYAELESSLEKKKNHYLYIIKNLLIYTIKNLFELKSVLLCENLNFYLSGHIYITFYLCSQKWKSISIQFSAKNKISFEIIF